MATAACSHTRTSPEGYAAPHAQSSAVRVQTMAGWEASVMLNDSRQEQVALHELWGLYFLSKMGFLNLPALGLLGRALSSAAWLARGSLCPTPDHAWGLLRFTGAARCITTTHVWKRHLCSKSKDESRSQQKGETVLSGGRESWESTEKDPRAEEEACGLGSEVSYCLCSDISLPYGSHQQLFFPLTPQLNWTKSGPGNPPKPKGQKRQKQHQKKGDVRMQSLQKTRSMWLHSSAIKKSYLPWCRGLALSAVIWTTDTEARERLLMVS